MPSSSSFFVAIIMMVCCFASAPALSSSEELHVQLSTISAAPAFLPDIAPVSPPSLSPEMEPLFPTPKAGAPSPSLESLPTIPASPSPPNPDATTLAPGPGLAASPAGSLPASSSLPTASPVTLTLSFFLGLLVLCTMQLSGISGM